MALKDFIQVTITCTSIGRCAIADFYYDLGVITAAERDADNAVIDLSCPSCGAAAYNGLAVEHADEAVAAGACALRKAP